VKLCSAYATYAWKDMADAEYAQKDIADAEYAWKAVTLMLSMRGREFSLYLV
jgi:hypothetical protein